MKALFISILQTLKKSFSYSGRSNRREFIYYVCFFYTYGGVMLLLDKSYHDNGWFLIFANMGFLVILALFSLITRRLHDLNASGWWQLIFIIPFGLILLFALPFKKGTEGVNRYGEPPKN